MKSTRFGILLLIAFCVKNALTDEIEIAKFAEEVAAVAQSKKELSNDYAIPQDSNYHPQLLVVEPHGISRVNLTKRTRWMFERTENTGGVDYHFARDRVYWSDLATGSIYSRPLNSKSFEAYKKELFVRRSPLHWRPRALAIDHITDHLYVVDSIGKTIHVFDLNHYENYVTFPRFLSNPLDIVVDPTEGFMFIADDTRLVRASLDGDSAKILISQSRYHIAAVTLDLDKKRVLWSEHSYRRIKSSYYDGSDKRTVLQSEEGKVYNLLGTLSIALYQKHLFFYDEAWRNVACVNVDGPNGSAVDRTYHSVYERVNVNRVRVVHPSLQKPIVNPCANEQCSTDQMCFITPKESSNTELGFTCTDASTSNPDSSSEKQ